MVQGTMHTWTWNRDGWPIRPGTVAGAVPWARPSHCRILSWTTGSGMVRIRPGTGTLRWSGAGGGGVVFSRLRRWASPATTRCRLHRRRNSPRTPGNPGKLQHPWGGTTVTTTVYTIRWWTLYRIYDDQYKSSSHVHGTVSGKIKTQNNRIRHT